MKRTWDRIQGLRWDTALATVIIVLALAAPAAVAGEATGPLRVASTLPLLAFVPGLAILRLVDPVERWLPAVLAAGVSLALDVVTSLALLYLHAWSILVALVALVVITLGATAARPRLAARRTA